MTGAIFSSMVFNYTYYTKRPNAKPFLEKYRDSPPRSQEDYGRVVCLVDTGSQMVVRGCPWYLTRYGVGNRYPPAGSTGSGSFVIASFFHLMSPRHDIT